MMALLLQASVQAGLLALFLLLFDGVLARRLAPRWRYGLWLLVLLRLLLPVVPNNPAGVVHPSAWMWPQGPAAQATEPSDRASAATIAPPPMAPLRIGAAPPTRESVNLSQDASAAAEGTTPGVERSTHTGMVWMGPGGSVQDPASSSLQDESSNESQATLQSQAVQKSAAGWPAVLLSVWLIGVGWSILRSLVAESRFRRGLRLRSKECPAHVHALLAECRAALAIRRSVAVVLVPDLPAPALAGIRRPCILLPPDAAAQLDDRELRFVLLHELCHLRRGDIAINWLLTLAHALHWFNPVIRHGLARLRAAQEDARDWEALRAAPDADSRSYAATVVKLLSWCPPRSLAAPVSTLLPRPSEAKRRIQMILNNRGNSRAQPIVGVCVASLLGWATLTGPAVPAAPQAPESASVLAETAAVAGAQQDAGVRVVRQDPEPRWRSEVREKLDLEYPVEFDGVDLSDAVATLRKLTGLNFVIDPEIIEEDFTIDINAAGRPLKHVLNLICGSLDIQWKATRGVIFLSYGGGPTEADLRFYDVSAMIESDWEEREERQDRLIDLIWNLSQDDSWDYDGVGMRFWNGQLIVTQSDEMHAEVKRILDMILARQGYDASTVPEWKSRLERAMQKTVGIRCDHMELGEVLDNLAEAHQIPLMLQRDYYEQDVQELVLGNMSLAEMLDWIASLYGLQVSMRDGAIWLAEGMPMEIRLYQVGDFLGLIPDPASGDRRTEAEMELANRYRSYLQSLQDDESLESEETIFEAQLELRELLYETVRSESWDWDYAGVYFWDEVMIVSQPQQVQERIGRFLATARKAFQ